MEQFQWERLEDTHLGGESGVWGLCCEMGVKIPILNQDMERFGVQTESKYNIISSELLAKAKGVTVLDP